MESPKEYLNDLCQQIRWKKAHGPIRAELEAHITDTYHHYLNAGLPPEQAMSQAIKDTGDATLLGSQLDAIHRPRPQWGMFGWVAGFLLLGLCISLFVFDHHHMAGRLFAMAIGTVAMMGAYFLDFTLLGKRPWVVCVSTGLVVWGLYHWHLPLFGMGGHTSQVFALLLPLAFAPVVFAAKGKGVLGLFFCLVAYGFLCVVALLAPAISGFAHMAMIGWVLLLVAAFKNWFSTHWVAKWAVALAPIVGGVAFLLLVGNRFTIHRLHVALNPSLDPLGFGFVPLQIRHVLRVAPLVGPMGPDMYFFGFSHWLADSYFLSSILYRYGWLAFLAILGLVIFFTVKVIQKVMGQKSGLGFFVSLAVALTFMVQSLLFITLNMGLAVPYVSLPFISPGNGSLVVNMLLAGFMLSVFRTGHGVQDAPAKPLANA